MNEKILLEYAIQVLYAGKVIVFPTETVYGIGVNGESEKAIEALYTLKGRDKEKATQLLIRDISWLDHYAQNICCEVIPFLKQCWPGALTVILPASKNVPQILLGNGKTIGIRIPNHPLTLTLLEKFGKGIAASSANPSGLPPASNIEEIKHYFGRDIVFLDGEPFPSGTSSTVIDAIQWPPKLIREGAIPWLTIMSILGAS